jgi:hypothetical protein
MAEHAIDAKKEGTMFLPGIEAGESRFHEVTTIFPPMEEEEYRSLVADIQEHGLREPIWTYQGKIIDGRHRSCACEQLGIEPTYREWDGNGSLTAFVVSLNLERRHLTSSQRAIVSLDVERRLAQEVQEKDLARKRMSTLEIFPKSSRVLPYKPKLHAASQAAMLTRTNAHYVTDAKKIAHDAPELEPLIKHGTLTLPEAKTLAKLPEKQRQEAVYLVKTGTSKSAKAAVLEIKKAEIASQVQATPSKPHIVHASWEQWLASQPPCDLLITDPPYSTDVEDIEAFAQAWLPLALSKVKSTGRAYVCIGAYPQEIRAYLNVQACLPIQQILVWEYKNTMGPSPKRTYKQNWQAILYFYGPDAPPLDCPLLTEQFSVQEINAPDGRLGNRFDTWQKPDALAEQLIRHSTRPGDRVYDIFCGTGTFLLAAQRLGRLGLGCDISEVMLAKAEKRGCAIAR